MPGYGVPDDLDGVLDWNWASTRLERSLNYWVATASAEGRPHAMPVWGVWLPETERFVFSCAPRARKARNLRANPRIVVTADDSVEVVVVEGTGHAGAGIRHHRAGGGVRAPGHPLGVVAPEVGRA